MRRQDSSDTPPSSSPAPSASSPTSADSAPEPTSSPVGVILPQNQPNPALRHFPYTPVTGANNSLYITPNVTSTDGLVEIKIGILLPYSLPNNLTQQLTYSGTSAIRLAASEINANQLIPGAYITLVLKDSFNGVDPENSGAAQAIFSTVALLQTDGGVSGVIGDVSSALTVQSALLTSRLSIPQCSYSAGSTQLSSKDDYGYFFRTIPTELMFGRVMMDFVVSRGWKTIAVLYTGDPLGSELMDSIAAHAKQRNINVGYQRAFWEMGNAADIASCLSGLKDSGQQIVLVAAVGIPQIRLMTEAVRQGLISKNFVWLAINQVTEPLLGMNGSSLKPTDLNGLFMFDNMLRLHGYPPYEEFLDKWATLDPAVYPQAYSCMMVMANGFANAVKGNWTALHLLAAGKLGSKLRPLDMNTNYTGPGGPMAFDDIGDVIYGNFILYNFQNGRVVSIGTSYSGVFNISSPPMYFDGTYNTPADSAPLRVLNPSFGSSIGIVIVAIAGLSILFALLTMGIVIVYRNAQIIKASSPLFCCLELCGFILLYLSTIMGLDIPSRFICEARPFTMNVGFVLVVSNIVAKNFRVYRIFHNIYVAKRVIRDSHLLKIVGAILAVNLIIMGVWFVKTPPKLQQVTMSDFTTYWECNSQAGESTPYFVVLFVYNVSLLLIATYLAYMNRNVAANYNECRQIAFVVYNILLSGCIAMPTIFLPPDQYYTRFFLSNVVLLFGTTVSLMFMFIPKLMQLFSLIEKKSMLDRAEGSDESSFDGILQQRAGWLSDVSGGGDNGRGRGGSSGSGANEGNAGSRPNYGRKGSINSMLEDSQGDTLKESHGGYMGVKFQHRHLSFLSIWCMRRVLLVPGEKYFTCFELGKPDSGRSYSYMSVFIHSREPDNYILRVIGRGRYDFLFQVRDEERLLYWCNLFENKEANQYSVAQDSYVHPLSDLPLGLSLTRSASDRTLSPTVRNGASGGLSRKLAEDASYFTNLSHDTNDLGSSPAGNAIRSPHPNQQQTQNHRHTASSYTMVTFATSPRPSINDADILHDHRQTHQRHHTMDPPSRQTTLGPPNVDIDLDGEGPIHPFERPSNSGRNFPSRTLFPS
ncbi:gamma-aminobutyric acid type B receptor [Entomortierella parvispora]|uniref:Gamma-aminobutyric acid type B receptor n=1 Tax=Entomortierella parvispora TaxID=205924 RepID=A0A9P3H194_9FUNG|nr:gamma-aminobutyric acid type B receptor [Entomortierella parvispora]